MKIHQPWPSVPVNASPLKRFAQDTCGNVVVEYCLLLGLLVGGGLLAYSYGAGSTTNRSFADVAAILETGETPPEVSRSDRTGPRDRQTEAETAAARPDNVTTALPRPFWKAAWLVLLAAGTASWYALHRRHRQQEIAQLEDTDSSEALSPSQRHRLYEKRGQIRNVLSNDTASLLGSSIRVRQLMSHRPITVEAPTPLEEVGAMMHDKTIRHVLVCGRNGELLGIISDRDARYRTGGTAEEVMTPHPLTVEPDSPINPAITMMLDRQISCLPVTQQNKPIGVLTSTDLMMSFQCTLQVLAKLAAELQSPIEERERSASRPETERPARAI